MQPRFTHHIDIKKYKVQIIAQMNSCRYWTCLWLNLFSGDTISQLQINIYAYIFMQSGEKESTPSFTSRCKTTYKNDYLKLLLQKIVLQATEILGFKQKYFCLTFVSHYRWFKILNNTAERSAVSETSP